MSGFLLDTDWCIDLINQQAIAVQALPAMVEEGVAISIISYGELYEGAYHGRNRTAALLVLARFVEAIEIVPLSRTIVERFGVERGALSRQDRRQIGDLDLLIGATALTWDLTLVTRNVRDYQLIPSIRLYQSTTP